MSYVDLCKIYYGVDRSGDDGSKSKYKKDTEKRIIVAGKKILGQDCDLWGWLEHRIHHRKDFWLFMHTVRGQWSEQAHRPIAKFFGDKDNTMLEPGYTEDDFNKFLGAQGEFHDFLLLYPRAFRKTTINSIDSAHWIVNSHGDIVILVITSTNPLGYKFVRALRSIFEVKDYSNPTIIQRIFPEHCIAEGSGLQTSFSSPIRRLGLKDPRLLLLNPWSLLDSPELVRIF